ncbi:MAG: putative selenate ABC transporter substrate-binding protein [Planctomycetota bacterium]
MRSTVSIPALWLSFIGLLGCGTSPEGDAPILRFTAIPDANRTELAQRFGPLAAYLEQELGLPVEYVPTSNYSASVEMFKNGDVLLAWFGGLTGVQARKAVQGAHAIAQGAVDPEFRTHFIVHAMDAEGFDGAFPADLLRGATFAFGSRQSTSGRLMPEHFIRQATGAGPEALFGEISFSGSHDKTAELVDRGAVDAGAINFRTYEELLAKGAISAETCRVVWTTPEYADYNWTAHPALEERFGAGTTDRLRVALLELDDPTLLAALQRPEGLIEARDADYAGIAEVAQALGFLRPSSR